MKRRTLLTAVGGSTLLAGCLDTGLADGGDGGDGDNDADDDGGPSGSIDTLGSGCAIDEEEWALAVQEPDEIAVEGTIPSPNPCHEATLGALDAGDGTLSATVDVTPTESDGPCAQCTGAVRYAISVDPGDTAIGAVEIDHASGETLDVDLLDADDPTSVASTDIETIRTDCGSEDDAEVRPRAATLQIAGTVPAPTPCHLATVESAEMVEGTLSLEIGVTPDEDAEVCEECVGEIQYAATVELDGPPLVEEVRVAHADHETHELTIDR